MLCQISNFWFDKTAHLIAQPPDPRSRWPACCPPASTSALYAKRSVVVKKLKPVPVEAIARGYLIGSGWKDYQRTGQVCGITLPDGPAPGREVLPEPIFTPSTKAAAGDHDENVSFDTVVAPIGAELAEQVRDATLAIYAFAAEYAAERGIIIADTKLEFGLDEDGVLHVMDEMLTPDSSRFWPADSYRSASARRATTSSSCATTWKRWTGTRPRPARSVPAEVIDATRAKYAEALLRLADISID